LGLTGLQFLLELNSVDCICFAEPLDLLVQWFGNRVVMSCDGMQIFGVIIVQENMLTKAYAFKALPFMKDSTQIWAVFKIE
jgi:hypothetical protein